MNKKHDGSGNGLHKLIGAAVPLILIALASNVPGATWVDGAKNEGKLAVYSSMSSSDTDTLIRKFQAKYPFVKATFLRLSSGRLMTKLFQEAQAGTYLADVYQTGSIEVYLFQKKGLVAKYSSPENKAYEDSFKDPHGYYTSFYFTPKVMGYNTRLIARDKAPRSYQDLLNPSWSGKLGMPGGNAGVRWLIGMMKRMGEEKGDAFMRKLAGQQIRLHPGITEATSLLAAGEHHALVFTNADNVEELKGKGAPVEWVADEPVTTTQTVLALSSRAPNPNAARLYIDFVLSREGQQIIQSFNRIPARSDVPSDPPNLKKGLKFFPYYGNWAEDENKYTEKFHSIFQ
ncbi:MAG: ABC transporter substrate-binding protein [Candidatus Binatia bacterium]